FTDVTATDLPPLLGYTGKVAIGDLDGDGDLDVFAPNYGQQSRVYTNLSRQLSWRGVPRLGKPLDPDLRRPAGGPTLLRAARAAANLSVPPFGTLRLDPASLVVVAAGAFDAQGRGHLAQRLPANPTLVGASIRVQALVGNPLGNLPLLGNVQTLTATRL